MSAESCHVKVFGFAHDIEKHLNDELLSGFVLAEVSLGTLVTPDDKWPELLVVTVCCEATDINHYRAHMTYGFFPESIQSHLNTQIAQGYQLERLLRVSIIIMDLENPSHLIITALRD